MKKTIKEVKKPAPERIYSSFGIELTSDVNEAIERMTPEDMFKLLAELAETPYFVAILKYTYLCDERFQGALRSYDPLKNPSDILQAQGRQVGLFDLPRAIIEELELRKKAIEGQ